jgi:hypothetical protein
LRVNRIFGHNLFTGFIISFTLYISRTVIQTQEKVLTPASTAEYSNEEIVGVLAVLGSRPDEVIF